MTGKFQFKEQTKVFKVQKRIKMAEYLIAQRMDAPKVAIITMLPLKEVKALTNQLSFKVN